MTSTARSAFRSIRQRIARDLLVSACLLALLTSMGAAGAGKASEKAFQEGVRAFSEGRYQEAAAAFQKALEDDPSSVPAKQNLASTWAALGHASLRGGNWAEAKRYAEKAIELCPQEATFHLLLAHILFRQGDYYYSRWAAKKALDIDPENAQAHELLGDILYQDSYLDAAVPEWEAALKGSRNREALQAKIERTRKEMNVEQTFGRDVSRHFILQYDGPVSRWVVQAVLKHMEEAFEQLRSELAAAPRGDITVILYPGRTFREVTSSPDWVGGRFDGKVRIPVGGLEDEAQAAQLKPMLIHELTHAFLRSMVPPGVPLWLEEGLAEYFEGMPAQAARGILGRTGRRFASLDEVSRDLRGGDIESAYAAALLAVHVLVEEEGFWTVRRMLEDVGSGKTVPEALRDEARLSMEEFQELWKRSMP